MLVLYISNTWIREQENTSLRPWEVLVFSFWPHEVAIDSQKTLLRYIEMVKAFRLSHKFCKCHVNLVYVLEIRDLSHMALYLARIINFTGQTGLQYRRFEYTYNDTRNNLS